MPHVMPAVHSVLVRPKFAANIGSAARATANISKKGQLILVSPRTSINSQARKMAAGAQETLNQSQSFDQWFEFIKQSPGIYIGLSRRQGKNRKPFTLPEVLVRSFHTNDSYKQNIYLIFGPEEDGLSSEDLDHCHMSAYLPAYGEFKSLNLAQAVLLAHYVCAQNLEKIFYAKDSYQQGRLDTFEKSIAGEHNLFPDQALMNFMSESLNLSANNFDASFKSLRRMILRSTPSRKELELLETLFIKSVKKMQQEHISKGKGS